MLEESDFTMFFCCKRFVFPRLKVEKPSDIELHVKKMLMMSNDPFIFLVIRDKQF